ncbi:MAG TPA: hypothetical protein VFP26_15435 [Gemmatimonadaceae bacterium]|nr:hypothetical protein [Gemmatimonadaceae bacterium]
MTVAVSVTVAPTLIEGVAGATVTVVTAGVGGGAAVTVTVAVPDTPEHVAVIVVVPAATPLTTPAPLTVAIELLLDDQVTVWPVITFPLASFTVATSVVVEPAPTDGVDGETLTELTVWGGGPDEGVDADATFDWFPKTASLFSVPRNATTWKLYAVDGVSPKTLHVR